MSKQSVYKFTRRPRRLRQSPAIRSMVEEVSLKASDLIQPLFIIDGNGDPEAVSAMPGVSRHPITHLLNECEAILKAGVPAIALFPNIDDALKDDTGKESLNSETLVLRAIREIKKKFPELAVLADIALDPYTTHGHDGILDEENKDIDNDKTVDALVKMAELTALAGADFVAPSDMMDGRIGAIRNKLDEAGFIKTGIISYSAKYASAYYGPFRDAVGSSQQKPVSKTTYQLDPANRREACIEASLDEAEGADILMVKPAGPYLDIIRDLRNKTDLPLAAYQVSGEYAQLIAASQNGWLDLTRCRHESLLSIKRAGADMILTYFAREYAESIA